MRSILPTVAGKVDQELVGQVDVNNTRRAALLQEGAGSRPTNLLSRETPSPESDGAFSTFPYGD
jgi:hypothetical protein